MKESLKNLIRETIILEYKLPTNDIEKSIISTMGDDCFKAKSTEKLVEIIYNSVLDYSYNEFELNEGNHFQMFTNAFGNKFRYNHNTTESRKTQFGFYGEVLLFAILNAIYKAPVYISRGYFYDPLSKGEAKGYDSYHLVEYNDKVELWFGEAKFHKSYTNGINDALKNIPKTLSNDYLNSNLITIAQKSDILESNSKISQILKKWSKGFIESIIDELTNNNIKLIYPILITYQEDKKGYNASIQNAINHIKKEASNLEFNKTSIEYSIFFIFIPLTEAEQVKTEVIKWIDSKQPLIQ